MIQARRIDTIRLALLLSASVQIVAGGCAVSSRACTPKAQQSRSAATATRSIQVSAHIRITNVPDGLSAFKKAGFSRYVSVFGVHIFSTPRTPEHKILHVANVLAQYLDNDEDGVPDNPLVLSHLLSRNAYLVFPADEEDFEALDPDDWHEAGYHCGQFQHAQETRPDFLIDGTIRAEAGWDYDASLEEVLHLITQHGYANAYPSVFAEERHSAIADCMDDARGGYFVEVPTGGPHYRYPEGSWFHYDDETCSYECMITEYFYWALTSVLGTQDYKGRFDAIRNEWELNTRALVVSGDPNVYALLTDPQYKLATRAPDGNYSPSALPTTVVPLISLDSEEDGANEDE